MNKSIDNEFYTVRGYQLKKQNKSGLTPALEDYLEMAYRLCLEEKYTRIYRLSESLNVRPSSASKMVSKLVALGFLEYDSCDSILLTAKGTTTGSYLLKRHYILERFLQLIGSESPLEETELVEHMLCPSTVLRIQTLHAFFEQNPTIAQQFKSFIELTLSPDIY